jgi:cytochrome c-type biogenesis protein CcmH
MIESKQALLFLKKKKQKNFDSSGPGAIHRRCQMPRTKRTKVFWFFFSKKNCFLSFAFLLTLLPALSFAQMVTRDGVALTQAQETRAENIGDQLRCLVCQNESIEGSSATLAKQLRVIIRQHVVAGDSSKSIMDFMVQRYGIFVLLKPPFMPLTWALYASPFVALLLGFLAYFIARATRSAPAAPLTDADRARLNELLK